MAADPLSEKIAKPCAQVSGFPSLESGQSYSHLLNFSKASVAACRTCPSLSLSNSVRAGMAVFASGPIVPHASAAACRISPSLSPSNSVRAGTAVLASEPMFPKAEAASRRTVPSLSLSKSCDGWNGRLGVRTDASVGSRSLPTDKPIVGFEQSNHGRNGLSRLRAGPLST